MTRLQKTLGAVLAAAIFVLTYFMYTKPSKKAINTLTTTPIGTMKKNDSAKMKPTEVTYSTKKDEVEVPGYSNPDGHN